MIKKPIIYTVMYLLLSTIIILISSGIIPVFDFCYLVSLQVFNNTTVFKFVPIVIIIILGISTYKLIGIKNNNKIIYHTIIPLFYFFSYFFIYNKVEEQYFLRNKNIVSYGVIEKKMQYKHARKIKYRIRIGNKELHITNKMDGMYFTKFDIGDTVLIQYVEKCNLITKIYDYTPTKQELEKCKNDCYLIDGKLIPITESKINN